MPTPSPRSTRSSRPATAAGISAAVEATAPTPTFEEALEVAESAARALDRADTPLDAAMAEFSRGVVALAAAQAALDTADAAVERLIAESDGSFATIPLDG